MTTSETTANPAPGWYPDPEQPASLRWWDGTTWTDHRAPGWQPPIGSGPGAPNHDLEYLLPVNRDGFAIASGYLGVFSIVPNPLTSIAAIAFGWIALHRITTSKKLGRGRAWFGIVFGAISLALFALLIVTASHHSGCGC